MPKYLVFLTDGPRGTLFQYIPNRYAYDVVTYYKEEFRYGGCTVDYLNNSTIIIGTPQPLKITKIPRKSRYLFDPHGQDKDREYDEHQILDEGFSCGYLIQMILDDPSIFPYIEEYDQEKYYNDLIPKFLKIHRKDYLMRKSNKQIKSSTEIWKTGGVIEHFAGLTGSSNWIFLILLLLYVSLYYKSKA